MASTFPLNGFKNHNNKTSCNCTSEYLNLTSIRTIRKKINTYVKF